MPVKPGYKMTEVGVIPEDWDPRRFSEIGTVVRGGSPRPAGDTRYFMGNYIPWLTVAALTNIPSYQMRVTETSSHLTKLGASQSRMLAKETLIIANSGATLGVAKILGISCCANDGIAAILNITSFDKAFVCHYLTTQVEHLRSVIATGNGQPNLNTGLIKQLVFPCPPRAEQTAIAQTLSDVDALIEALSATLAKKRDIKQATMQQLLTGKTRLPGFAVSSNYKMTEVGLIPKDWEVRLLPEICRFRAGKAHEQVISDSGTYVCVNSKFISTDGVTRKYATRNFCIAKKDDILMVMSDLPNGKALAKTFLADQDDLYAVNQRVCALTTIDGASGFLRFLFNRNEYFLKFDDGVSQTHLLNRVFLKFQFAAPRHVSEQLAIAQTLTDLDAELTALEARIDKTRALKLGMMQELLTGRTRLP